MQFFHKNKSQPTLLNPLPESAPHSLSAEDLPPPPPQHQHQHQHQHHHNHHHQDYQYTHPAHANTSGHSNISGHPNTSGHPNNFSLPLHPARPALNVVPSAHPDLLDTALSAASAASSAPHSTEASPLTESQPRKSRRSFFGLKDRAPAQKLGRNTSVRKKISAPIPLGPSEDLDYLEKRLPQVPSNSSQQSLSLSQQSASHSLLYPSRASRSSSHLDQPAADHPHPQIQRVSTEPPSRGAPSPDDGQHRPNPQFQIDQPQHGHRPSHSADQASSVPPRPPSQQSLGPPSPLHQQQQQQLDSIKPFRQSLQPIPPPGQGMAHERPTGLRQPMDQQPPQQMPLQQQQQQQQHAVPGLVQGQSFKVTGGSASAGPGDRDQETPPPGKAKDDPAELDLNGWIVKYEELQLKYNRVKRYYFEKDAQVQQLQNTVAHQRMSASRTVLDDNEYATRLGRLDGAINNLAFNIRKDWKNIPPWLAAVVNEDAHSVGTKEMTAVGRACLTRWIVDELFDRYFHPGLEPNLSRQLKLIERNVRRLGKFVTEEEQENHLSKVSSWRRTTLDGLGDIFQSKLADEHRALLTRNLVEKLTASLEMNLKTPPPPGLENGVAMIVELAVGICANIPLESRDISIEYFLPGALIADSHMKLETTLPPLANPGLGAGVSAGPGTEPSSAATDRMDQSSIKGLEAISAAAVDGQVGLEDKDPNFSLPPQQPTDRGRKKSVFGSLMGKKPHPAGGQADPSGPPTTAAHFRDRDEALGMMGLEKENENRIRFAAFVAAEVRGKGTGNVIVKAPVYPFS